VIPSSIHQFELRLAMALVAGSLIGFERQYQRKMAGMRTYALVSVGSALFVLMALEVTGDNSSASRVAAQIVTGIGFLGAGVIMKEGLNVIGINTAATVWCSGAIGCLAGLGLWYETVVGTAFILFTNVVMRPLGKQIFSRISTDKQGNYKYKLTLRVKEEAEITGRDLVLNLLNTTHLVVASMNINDDVDMKETEMIMEVRSRIDQSKALDSIVQRLQQMGDNIVEVMWELIPDND
jgi:putative Mg2+ transporter-C (MgtC) family protein